MRMKGTLIAAIGLLALGFTGLVLAVVFYAPTTGWGTGSGTRDAARANPHDAMFLSQMIPHHEDAVQMADLALARAEHEELRTLAADVKRVQTAEIVTMREWHRAWFGEEVPGTNDGRGQGQRRSAAVRHLEQTTDGESFDRAFLELMIPHHEMGVMMASMAGRRSGREELRSLALTMVDSQGREIEQMRAWYEEWYGSGHAEDS